VAIVKALFNDASCAPRHHSRESKAPHLGDGGAHPVARSP